MDMNLNLLNLNLPKLHGLETSDWTVVVSGISVVIGILLLLVVVIYVYGLLVSKMEASAKKREEQRQQKKKEIEAAVSAAPVQNIPAPVPTQAAPAPAVEPGISGEVVAAISAAVYSMEGNKNVAITAIRKQNPITSRNPWAQAAVIDNTRPF